VFSNVDKRVIKGGCDYDFDRLLEKILGLFTTINSFDNELKTLMNSEIKQFESMNKFKKLEF
jgi:hypothetical protein